MLTAPVIVIASFAYVGLLFAIAYYGDKRADAGRGIIAKAPSCSALRTVRPRDPNQSLRRAQTDCIHPMKLTLS